MCCFKRETSSRKRFNNSKVWCPLIFLLNCYPHNGNTRQKHEEQDAQLGIESVGQIVKDSNDNRS